MAYCLKCGKKTTSSDFYCSDCQLRSAEELEQEMEHSGGSRLSGFTRSFSRFLAPGKRKILIVLFAAIMLVPGLIVILVLTSAFAPHSSQEEGTGDACSIVVPQDYENIQEAIDAASPGDIILVQPGVYQENIDFQGKELVLQSSDPGDDDVVASTVIEGGDGGPAVTFQRGENEETVIHGFTITGKSGAAVVYQDLYGDREQGVEGCGGGGILVQGDSSPVIVGNVITGIDLTGGFCGKSSAGAGVFIRQAAPQLINNTFTGNSAHRGGAIYIFDASPLLSGNIVSGNSASWEGGGIYMFGETSATLEGNQIIENKAEKGGGIFLSGTSAYIRYNEISGNQAVFTGGGLFIRQSEQATVSGNLFQQNQGGECGGGLALEEASPRVAGNTFQENDAGWRGGGGAYIFLRSNPRMINNTWTGNTAGEGSAAWVSNDSSPDFATVELEDDSKLEDGPNRDEFFFQQ